MTHAGILLCGGASRRMGQPKEWLVFDGEPLLFRVVRVVADAIKPLIVVAGPNQLLPNLPADVIIARDPIEHQGPLVGLAAGLAVAPVETQHVFVTGCDAPFLKSDLIRLLLSRVRAHHAVVPVVGNLRRPLPAVYPIEAGSIIPTLLAAGRRSLHSLLEAIDFDELSEQGIKTVDPALASFQPMNEPAEYARAIGSLAHECGHQNN